MLFSKCVVLADNPGTGAMSLAITTTPMGGIVAPPDTTW